MRAKVEYVAILFAVLVAVFAVYLLAGDHIARAFSDAARMEMNQR